MSKLPSFTPQELYRLKKIVQWNPDRPLARGANAILLQVKGKSKTEIAELSQAARSSVIRWINWYLRDDIDGSHADLLGRKVRFKPEFIGKLLRFMTGYSLQEFSYQHSRSETARNRAAERAEYCAQQLQNPALVTQARHSLATCGTDDVYQNATN